VPDDDPGIRLQALLLADHANIRENLISVLSAGITRAELATYPGHFPAFLVMVVYAPADQLGIAHEVDIRFKYPATAMTFAEMKVQFPVADGKLFPGEGQQIPFAIPIHGIPFPETGQVDVQVSLNGQHSGDLTFWLLPPGSLAAQQSSPR
jgi:hypothetical protein